MLNKGASMSVRPYRPCEERGEAPVWTGGAERAGSPPSLDNVMRVTVVSAVLSCVLFSLAGCTNDGPAEVSTPRARPVSVMQLTERDFDNEIRLTGSVALYRQENVGFEVDGRVLLVMDLGKEVEGPSYDGAGRMVRPGDVIAKLDDTRKQLQVQGTRARLKSLEKQLEARRIEASQVAKANLKAAQARLRGAETEIEAARQQIRAAEATLRLAAQTRDRQQRLMAQGAGRQQDMDDAHSNYDRMLARKAQMEAALSTRRSAVDAHQAEVATAEAAIALKQAEVESIQARINETQGELKRAEEDLKDTVLHAPFTGRITRVHVTQGAVVQAGNPVVTLSLLDPIKIEVQVSADHDRRIHTGDRVEIFPKDPIGQRGETMPFHAMVYEKGAVADPRTRTFRIDLLARNARRRVHEFAPNTRGLPVVQNILPAIRRFHGEEGALFVETHAIYRENGNAYVLRLPDANLDRGSRRSVVGRHTPEKVPVVLGHEYYRIVSWTMQSLEQHGDLHEGDILVLNPRSEHLSGLAYGRPQWVLRPGDLVPVHFLSDKTPRGFYVPVDAITKFDDRHLIYVAEDNRAQAREITVHESYGELRRIEGAGLANGVEVIVAGVHYVSDDQPIQIVQR